MNAKDQLRALLAKADVEVNGARPWDLQVHNEDLFTRVMAEGTLGFGEAYMDGWWDCDALDALFYRLVRDDIGAELKMTPELFWLALRSRIQNLQSRRRAFEVARVHYDLDVDVFEATFDRRLTGSCAYWRNANDLDQAQNAKLDLICRKIGLKRGQSVLDIGCGWGAFMGFAAEVYGANCVGVTVSREQVDYAKRRYAHLPVAPKLLDYRAFTGQADHVVSMGMFEHVGHKNYRTYFETARRALRGGGIFLLHTIFQRERSPRIEPWLNKYIFPNGVLPTVGQIGKAVEGLFVVEDLENFGAYYDRTLMAWRANFTTHWPAMAAKYGERFCRMWDYYLASCAGGFRSRRLSVGQFVLSPDGVRGGWRLSQ
ncbi:MAG TPA: cyclopropane fatty acyl phospholipid synthase [Caulobacteraceae bacterium]|nr:cyclopropane fatty acyl phospholipid synthase [Caulobacteraceae bacterium]